MIAGASQYVAAGCCKKLAGRIPKGVTEVQSLRKCPRDPQPKHLSVGPATCAAEVTFPTKKLIVSINLYTGRNPPAAVFAFSFALPCY